MEKYELLNKIKEILTVNNLTLSCAESCTGGLISSYLTDISGSSLYINQNFVTYSNEAKHKFLNVKKGTLNKYGAVSFETAYEMARGLLKYTNCSIATTGILGPTGGTKDKPVGLVYISYGYKNSDNKEKIEVTRYISNKKDRYSIKVDIVEYALNNLLIFLKNTLN